MDRDPTAIVTAVGLLCLALVGLALAAAFVRRRREASTEGAERLRRERDAVQRKAVDAGTHIRLADGSVVPSCRVPGCDAAAQCRPLKFAREEGLGDFVRRLFGAPPRLRVIEDTWGELVRCESHQYLAREEMRLKLAELERRRQEHQRDGEVELGHFERNLATRVELVVENHAKQLGGRKRKSADVKGNVLPFSSSRPSTGTDAR